MARFNPRDVLSSYSSIAALNANFSEIADLLDQAVMRTGEAPNAMQADLDLNHFRIRNIGAPVEGNDVARWADVLQYVGSPNGLVELLAAPNGVSMIGGSFRSLDTVEDLASLNTEAFKFAFLAEEGRQGVFSWNSADLSAEVAADTEKGLYIAPNTDLTGASGAWVRKHDGTLNPEWFGVSKTATELENVTTMNAALATANALGLVMFRFPGGVYPFGYGDEMPANSVDVGFGVDGGATYNGWSGMLISAGPMAVDLRGTTLTGKHARITVAAGADDVLIVGGNVVDTLGELLGTNSPNGTLLTAANLRSTYLYNFAGTNITVTGNTHFQKVPALTGGYTGYIRSTSNKVVMNGFKQTGGNGIFTQGQNHSFSNFVLTAPDSGGDDCFALKAAQPDASTIIVTQNINIGPGVIRNYACSAAIGSEVGSPGSIGNDPNFQNTVRNVVVHDIAMENCTYIGLIKPGTVSSINYRDGTVEDILFDNIVLTDLEGTKFRRGFNIGVGRGSRVRRITGTNLQVNARAFDNGASGPTIGGVYLYNYDYTGTDGAASAEPTISDVDIEIKYNDPYNGVDNGASAPGYPVQSVIRAENQTAAYGVMERIKLNVRGNGSKERAVYILDGLDDAITLKADLRNVCVNPTAPAATRGGLVSLSDVKIDSLTVSSLGSGFPVGGTDSTTYGTTAYKNTRREHINIGSYGAGTSADKSVWTTRKSTYIHKVEWLDSAGVAVDAVNYTTLALINQSTGAALASTSTASTALTADTPIPSDTAPSLRSANALNIPAGTPIRFTKTDTGTGKAITDLVCVIHYIEHGA